MQALGFDVPLEVPPRFRQRFARLPQSTLQFGSFLSDVLVPGINSFSVSLTASPVIAAAPGRPAWSPNGRRLAFAQARSGHVHLFAARVDSTAEPRQLTRSPGRDLNPRWSPDGRVIAFERHVAGEADLYSVRPDGTGLRRLTYWRGQERSPDFSPDGGSLVFSSNLTGRYQLYVVPTGGSFPRRLTSDFGDDERPVWSPDGRWIAFSSDRDGDADVFLISPQGGRERKLTHNASQDLVQEWQPLRDARPPVVRALPSSAPRGGAAQLRYTLRDRSPRVLVFGDAQFRVEVFGRDSITSRGIGQRIVRTSPRRLHAIRVSPEELLSFSDSGDAAAEPPSRFRFCIVAVDPWGNGSSRSCAIFRFR